MHYFCRNRNTCFENTFSCQGVVYYCLRFYLQQPSLVNSLGSMGSVGIMDQIFDPPFILTYAKLYGPVPPTPPKPFLEPCQNFMDSHNPRTPRYPCHPRNLADSLQPDAYRIETYQFWQLVYLSKIHAIPCNSHVYCNEMKFNSWICNTNSYNLWTKSCILSQLTFWCNLQLVNPTRNSSMI